MVELCCQPGRLRHRRRDLLSQARLLGNKPLVANQCISQTRLSRPCSGHMPGTSQQPDDQTGNSTDDEAYDQALGHEQAPFCLDLVLGLVMLNLVLTFMPLTVLTIVPCDRARGDGRR
jgi:hypothetical protein